MRFPATPGWVSLPVVVGVPRHSWLRAPGAVPRHSSLGSAGGSGVWSLATPGCGSWMRFPATPGLGGPPALVVGGPSPLLGEGPGRVFLRLSRPWVPGTVPRHSWLGSAGRSSGCFRGVGWESFPCCVCLWRGACAWCLCWCVCCVFVVSVLKVVRLWVCLPRVFLCVCLCVRGVSVACGCRSLLPPAGAVVAVDGGVAGVCCGWSLATPGGGS